MLLAALLSSSPIDFHIHLLSHGQCKIRGKYLQEVSVILSLWATHNILLNNIEFNLYHGYFATLIPVGCSF